MSIGKQAQTAEHLGDDKNLRAIHIGCCIFSLLQFFQEVASFLSMSYNRITGMARSESNSYQKDHIADALESVR